MKFIAVLLAISPSVFAHPSSQDLYLTSSSFDTFFYVDRSSISAQDETKTFNLTYIQNGYRGLVVSQISAVADCATPYQVQLLDETVYQKHTTENVTTAFTMEPVARFTSFPVSEVVKENATINNGEYGFWGQTWISVCENQWKGKHHLGDATIKLTVLDARNISKGAIKETVVQTIEGSHWLYRATTPPEQIDL